MRSGRNSGNWIVGMLAKYPLRCVVVVGVLALLNIGVRDRSSQDGTPLPSITARSIITINGMATVTDGDSLRINGQKIRLWAIDAPELKQTCQFSSASWPCGTDALNALINRIDKQPVSCRQEDIDRYGRIVAECFAGNTNLNEWLVAHGWALAYRQYSTKFVEAENKARLQQAGMWRGEFTKPWDWRRQQR